LKGDTKSSINYFGFVIYGALNLIYGSESCVSFYLLCVLSPYNSVMLCSVMIGIISGFHQQYTGVFILFYILLLSTTSTTTTAITTIRYSSFCFGFIDHSFCS